MRTDDFDFALPPELIAQVPAARRDASRLLVLDRATGQVAHKAFRDLLGYLRAGDVLVMNNSRVIPARLRGVNARTGGQFEVLLLEENAANDWWVMLRPGKRAPVGTRIIFCDHSGATTDVAAEVVATNEEGHRRLRFSFERSAEHRLGTTPNILDLLDQLGEMPLPPYIERAPGKTSDADFERYQTVFAQPAGSVAAPTAGLHFTPELLDEIRTRGVTICFVTLHVGLGTFAPVKAETLADHIMHEERFEVSEATAEAVNAAKREGRRVIAIGTTSVRVLESACDRASLPINPPTPTPSQEGNCVGGASRFAPLLGGGGGGFPDSVRESFRPATIRPSPGRTRIFIHPPHTFKVVDALLTNFHLPRSTLLMLVSAFAAPGELRGRELVLHAYAEAVRERYRFFSYGDAMFIQ